MNWITTNIRFPEDLYMELKMEAARRRKSVASVVREKLAKKKPKPVEPELMPIEPETPKIEEGKPQKQEDATEPNGSNTEPEEPTTKTEKAQLEKRERLVAKRGGGENKEEYSIEEELKNYKKGQDVVVGMLGDSGEMMYDTLKWKFIEVLVDSRIGKDEKIVIVENEEGGRIRIPAIIFIDMQRKRGKPEKLEKPEPVPKKIEQIKKTEQTEQKERPVGNKIEDAKSMSELHNILENMTQDELQQDIWNYGTMSDIKKQEALIWLRSHIEFDKKLLFKGINTGQIKNIEEVTDYLNNEMKNDSFNRKFKKVIVNLLTKEAEEFLLKRR